MTLEQERAEFEAWAQNSFELHRHSAGEYSSNFTQTAWAAWQARATLQSQDREDDPDTIRALLAERDALDAECADLAHQLNQSNERNGVLRASLKECSAELFAQCGDQKRAMQYVERARAALTQEQGGSDAA